MERKLRVLLIIGKSQSFRILDVFEPMAEDWELSAASFLVDLRKPSYLTQISLQTYIEDQHLPGYMRGLEEAISRSDLIVASGCTDHASIQAMRFCKAGGKPLLIFIDERESLLTFSENEAFGIEQVLDHVRGFVVSDDSLVEQLEFIGVQSNRIVSVPLQAPISRLAFQPQLRKKFREYIGLNDEQFLVLCADQVETYGRGTNLLMAVKYLIQRRLIAPQALRVLFTGSGPAKEQLKYLAVDSGIAGQVLFINQDTSPFQRDLYCAADLCVSLSKRYQSLKQEEGADYWVLEGLACGLRPLVGTQNSIASKLSEEFTVDVNNFEALALAILLAMQQRHEEIYSRKLISQLCYDRFDTGGGREAILELGERLARKSPATSDTSPHLPEIMSQVRSNWNLVPADELMATIDSALILWERQPDEKGQIELLKAQLLLREGQLDPAMALFELCTGDERLQREAYLGLGKIALSTCGYDEAQSFYRKALAIKANDVEAMIGIGQVYRKSGRPEDAVYWLGKSLNIDAENQTLLLALTQACLESEDSQHSIAVLEQLRVVLGEKAPLIMALGQLYYRTGEAEIGHILVHQALNISKEQDQKLLPSSSNAG